VHRLTVKKKEGHGAVSKTKSREEVSSVVAREEKAGEPKFVKQEGSFTWKILTRSISRGEASQVSPRGDVVPPPPSETLVEAFQLGKSESGDVLTILPRRRTFPLGVLSGECFYAWGTVALGHGNFLQGLEEFEGVPTRARVRSLENGIFRVSPLAALCCPFDT